MKQFISLLGVAFLTSGVAFAQCNKETFAQHKAEAEASRKKASSVGGEWWMASMPNPMKNADEAAKAGKYEQACELVQMVKDWGELGYAQALREKNAGPRF